MKKLLIILLSGFVLISCGGNGGGGNDPTPPNLKTVFFKSNNDSPGNNAIYMSQDSASGVEILLSINAKELTNVYGASFVLEYDPNIVNYVTNSAIEGDFFSYNNIATTGFQAQLENKTEGRLIIGISRKKDSTQNGRTGSGKIGQIKFKAVNKGKTAISFVNSGLKDFQDKDILCTWIGGEITGAE